MYNQQFKYSTLNLLGKRKRVETGGGVASGHDQEGETIPGGSVSQIQQEFLYKQYDLSIKENKKIIQQNGIIENDDDELEPVQNQSKAEDFISMEETKNIPLINLVSDCSDVNQSQSESDQDVPGSVPWIRYCRGFNSRTASLHNEIVQFTKCLEPTSEEKKAREDAVQDVTNVINQIYANSKVHVFGSFATGLYVPTSDIDLVVAHDEESACSAFRDELDGMRACANLLTREGVAENAKVISKAKVPIIKFEHAKSGVHIDVSFGKENGPQAAEYILSMLKKWPMMRHLIVLLKVFLQQREMNEVYTGGIGSYALVTMVVCALQLHMSRKNNQKINNNKKSQQSQCMDMNLGILLIDFFRLYGRVLNFETVGVSANDGGRFFQKEEFGFDQDKKFIYSVQDPNDMFNDLARGSWGSAKVRNAFDHAYSMMTTKKFEEGESMLGKLLNLDLVLAGRGKTSKDLMNRKKVKKT